MGTTSKALALLDFFTRDRPSIGLSDMARLTGINKATCFRLMSELAEHGFAEQIPSSKEYRIGPAVLRLAALREASVPTRQAAQPLLQALASETGETAHMSQLVAGRLGTIAFAYAASSGMQVMMEDADHLPFHATSSGHAVLAWLPEAQQAQILSAPLPALTDRTETDPAALRRMLAAVRAEGWAASRNSFETDVASLAVPLFDPQGAVQGAVAIAAPAMRMDAANAQAILRRLIPAARALMALWGGQPPADLAALWQRV